VRFLHCEHGGKGRGQRREMGMVLEKVVERGGNVADVADV
jgi:hypothetical protein